MNDFLLEDVDVYNQEFEALKLTEIYFKNKSVGNVTFSSSSLTGCTFDTVVFNHVVFSKVDLSNVNFTNCGLHHCKFIDCKMVGTNFSDSILKCCTLENILGHYLGMALCKIQDFFIKDSDFLESRFLEVMHSKWTLENVNLKGTEFNRVSLNGIDLSTCHIEKVLIDVNYLKGVLLSYSQVIDIVPLLGIILK